MTTCNVCGTDMGAPIFQSGKARSLTTMNALIEGETVLYFCETCDHTQTAELPDLVRYYAEEYTINLDSADDDQLYDVVDGVEVYRSDHQARVLRDKIDLTQFSNVLDYGCAKGATLRKLVALAPGVKAHLYDVTEKYIPFWEDFPGEKDWAAHRPKPQWMGKMDVVLSFYALEHIPHLGEILNDVTGLLRPGGYFYFLVPNMFANAADFIVADHVNHFSRNSLEVMLARAGFAEIEIDTEVHAAAFVVKARLDPEAAQVPDVTPQMRAEVEGLATFWGGIKDRIQAFEADLPADLPIHVYGAGIYGNFILSCMARGDEVRGFLDQNKFLIGKQVNGLPVVHPSDLPEGPCALLVGLNPKRARDIIASIPALTGRPLEVFFLE